MPKFLVGISIFVHYSKAMGPNRFLFILVFFLTGNLGCTSLRDKRIAASAAGFIAGAAIGSQTAPEGERKELHSLYWAGLTGLTASVVANYIYDDQEALDKSRLESSKLQAELDLIHNSNKVLLKEGKGYFKNTQGEEFFQNGRAKWRIYQIDKWTKDGPNKLYHQDKMVELLPDTNESQADGKK